MPIALACALLGLSTVHASDKNLSLEANGSVASRYVYRGVERSTENWQTSLEGTVAGWRGRVWSSRPWGSEAPGELQSTLGYSWAKADQWTIEVNGTHFWYVDAPVKGAPAHSFEGAVKLSWITRSHWRPAVEFAYDIRFRSRALEASLARDITLGATGTVLELRAYGGHVAADDVLPDTRGISIRDDYIYFGVSARWLYKIGQHWEMQVETSVAGTASQAEAWSPVGGGSGTRGWIGIGTNYRF